MRDSTRSTSRASSVTSSARRISARSSSRSTAKFSGATVPFQRIIENGAENTPKWWLTHQFSIPGEDGHPAMVGTIALDITEQKLQEEKVSRLTWHDPGTGLPNGALLHDRLCRTLERGSGEDAGLAVIVWDIKRFRVINDSFGRQVGDALLQEVAKRAAALWPSMKQMGRLSGDYFAGFIEIPGSASDIAHLLERSLAALSEPFMAEQEGKRRALPRVE